MILLIAALTAASPGVVSLAEAERALSLGRTEQAREMIGAAVADGSSGPEVDRLLADLAFAEQRWAEASARYIALTSGGKASGALLERAGLATLHSGDPALAVTLLDRAVRLPGSSWRARNGRGVAADRLADWTEADRAYAAGLAASPDEPTLLNNLGWSLLLRGQWDEAIDPLTRAAALAPGNRRVVANLELARAALSERLPRRRAGESAADYAARLNDAGVVALRQGKKAKAAGAFAQALEASDRWFTRAANNLALAEAAELRP